MGYLLPMFFWNLLLTDFMGIAFGQDALPDQQSPNSSRSVDKEFVSLFDGKTLDGWQIRGGNATYNVEENTIVGTTVNWSPNTFLCTNRVFDNFELQLDVKCDSELNAGIQIRSHVYKKATPQASNPERIRKVGEVYGYQVEVSADGNAGRIWDEARFAKWLGKAPSRDTKQAYKGGEWNQYRIIARGDHVQTWVNNIKVADIRDLSDVSGFIGLQVHGIRPDMGPFKVRWRNIYIRDISVKPGINKFFISPKVTDFVERWEKEGRELYDKRNEIVKACRIKPGMVVGDIGAGTGLFTQLLSKSVGNKGKVYAVDIAEDFVKHVEATCREQGINNVEGIVCLDDDVKLAPQSIDVAFISATYHHFEFPHKTMTSIHKALRPGGRVIVIDFVRREKVSSEWILSHVRADQKTVTKEIVGSGFKLVEKQNLLKDNYFLIFEVNSNSPFFK